MEEPGEYGLPNKLSRAHMRQRLKGQAPGLHLSAPGPLCICYNCFMCVYWGGGTTNNGRWYLSDSFA